MSDDSWTSLWACSACGKMVRVHDGEYVEHNREMCLEIRLAKALARIKELEEKEAGDE